MSVVTVEKILPQHWYKLAELAHTICFGEFRPESLNKHHFIMGAFLNKEIMGYTTCLEMDSETVYLQHGGAFPNYEKTIHVMQAYQAMLNDLSLNYKRVWTRIKNTNKPMLRIALKVGFLITGIYQFGGDTLVELELEFTPKGEV